MTERENAQEKNSGVSSEFLSKQPKKKGALLLNKIRKNTSLYILLIPSVVVLFIFCYIPMYGVIIAFKDYNSFLGIGGSPWTDYYGFKHFVNFVTSSDFTLIIKNTLIISLTSILVNTPFPIVLALMINEVRIKWFRKGVQTISYAPYFVSVVVIVGMCAACTNPDNGIFNKAAEAMGLGGLSYQLHSEWFLPTYLISGLWQGCGWWAIIYVGTLSNVDPELHEAAIIDGAGRIKRILHINLPAILPIATIMLIMSIGNLLNVGFEKVYLMQTDLNVESSEVIATYLYKQTFFSKGLKPYSYGAAVGLFNTAINLVFLFAANIISKKAGGETLL